MMEEASFAAVNGELSPFTTGVTACRMISACRDLTDYRRASEWIEATERYCDQQSLAGFPGVCRVHRAEVAAVTGAWDSAEQELERATIELERFQRHPAAGGRVLRDRRHPTAEGRLRGRRGGPARRARTRPLAAARAGPHPARGGQGQGRRPPRSMPPSPTRRWDRWARARLLPAQVEIAIAAGDLARARTAVDELAEIVAGLSVASARGRAARSRWGACCSPRATRPAAARELRTAIKGWREVGSPYEVARARALLSRALRATGSDDEARPGAASRDGDLPASRGAVDLEAAEREPPRRGGPPVAAPDGPQDLHVHRHRRIHQPGRGARRSRLGAAPALARRHAPRRWSPAAEARSSTRPGDGFFAAFDSARSGIDCAIAIQRALVEHRDATGFALSVRIGLHTRRGESPRHRLQRQGRPRRGAGWSAGRWRRDPGDRRDRGRGRRAADDRRKVGRDPRRQ